MRAVCLLLAGVTAVAGACSDLTLKNGFDWRDDGGEKYTCKEWYNNNERCEKTGGKFAFGGFTAQQACCACGGGSEPKSSTETCVPTEGWTHPKYKDTCDDYAPGTNGFKYACGEDVKEFCCHCAGTKTSNGKDGVCRKESGWKHPKYGDTCDMYEAGGKSFKYRCGADVAPFCCSCDDSSGKPTLLSTSKSCAVVDGWKHPKYGDTCAAYMEGGKSVKYKCTDIEAKKSCCSCPDEASSTKSVTMIDTGDCQDRMTSTMEQWHDDGGSLYTCEYYGEAGKNRCAKTGDKYENFGMKANDACCACGGGKQGGIECEDIPLTDGSLFHDAGGAQYTCDYYGRNKEERCGFGNMGDDHAFDGLTANKACCACDGGKRETAGIEEMIGLMEPRLDEGDDIQFEWVGAKFYNKKHMAGDFLIYWNTNTKTKTLDVAVIGPAGWNENEKYIAIGFSATGGMAGSDAVVAYFDKNGAPIILDVYLKNQAPSGIILADRQDLTSKGIKKFQNRIVLKFTRPWKPSNNAAEVKPTSEFLSLIYSKGKVNSKCKLFCNHESTDRWQSAVAMAAPSGMKLYDLNRGLKGEPCQGVARLECSDGFSCYHEISLTGDNFAPDWKNYGICVDPDTLGDTGVDTTLGVQNIFANGGGFENEEALQGGFVLLWTINKLSPPGSYGPEDSMTVAVVSTSAQRQGWIGFGFSPNGLMMGSDVMVGWAKGADNFVGDYFLEAQVASANVPMDKQELTNYRIIQKNGQTAITFERPLTPADSVQILEGDVHIIYANGPLPDDDSIASGSQFIPYHRYRAMQDVVFIPYTGKNVEANKIGEMGLCGRGPNDLGEMECKKDLICFPFPPDFFDVNWDEMVNEATSNTEGYTANSEWSEDLGKRAEGETNPFSDLDHLRGKGVCLTEGQIASAKNYDFKKMATTQIVDPSAYDFNQKLRWGFDIYWKHKPHATDPRLDSISIALVSAIGAGWVGIAFGTKGAMIGSTAIIGWKEFGAESNSLVDEYYLNNKLPWEVKAISKNPGDIIHSMEVTNMVVDNMGHENSLTFDRPLAPKNGFEPIVPGSPTTLLFAVGNVPNPVDQYFGYHRFRDIGVVDFKTSKNTARG